MQRMAREGDLALGVAEGDMLLDRVGQPPALLPRIFLTHRRSPLFRIHGHKSAALLAVPLLAACNGPLSTLNPAGPAAQHGARLWWVMLAGSALITLLVGVMLVLAMRHRGEGGIGRAPDPARERHWIMGWGLGFSLTVLTALLTFALWTGERIITRDDGTLQVQAEAEQWGWTFTQPGPGGAPVRTEGILYVPAGRPFDVALTSQDVIHSFWVPQLGGKMDAIPGHQNVHRLSADRPGIYEGLCAEFCGLGHATMRFTVVAYDPDGPLPAFESQLADTATSPVPPAEVRAAEPDSDRLEPGEPTPEQSATDPTDPEEPRP
ncbi:cytochrome B [Paracoccus gahaiensis]|uniref:Cytochrome B n=1 Tax=Paracoccus gahaiensis TaxID=1706839 RepID=A0A4V5MVZ4_9RHOB|nr:cytochrome B [Paracoccus gahaiensis]